ncbi:MAG: PD-(D/E)XK nuclease-like domain-containing protein [Bacteroidales bacterium]|nr:PD-(D/E)XK nuclease-like domain-containing protein [Bacteroidales bacterium]
MTETEYRQHPAISRSELFKIRESPEKFKYYREHPEEPTPALLFGQLFHAMALQPETVADLFAVAPNVDRRTKTGKEEFANFESEAEGKTVVTADMYQQAMEMCEALNKDEYVKKLLKGEKEKSFFWDDDLTGEQCKCRTDCLTEVGDNLIIVDLKSTENAETEAFIHSAIKYGYDVQSAMYSEGVKINTGRDPLFVFIAIEKKPPYAINILQADKLLIRRGYDLFRELIGIYHECKTTDNWWGYLGRYNQINNLALPAYLAKEVE